MIESTRLLRAGQMGASCEFPRRVAATTAHLSPAAPRGRAETGREPSPEPLPATPASKGRLSALVDKPAPRDGLVGHYFTLTETRFTGLLPAAPIALTSTVYLPLASLPAANLGADTVFHLPGLPLRFTRT